MTLSKAAQNPAFQALVSALLMLAALFSVATTAAADEEALAQKRRQRVNSRSCCQWTCAGPLEETSGVPLREALDCHGTSVTGH